MLPREGAMWEFQIPSSPRHVLGNGDTLAGLWHSLHMPSCCGNLSHPSSCAQPHHHHQVRDISKASEGMALAIYGDPAISHF